MIIHAHGVPSASVSSVLLCPWFVLLVFAGAIERLCGLALGVAMERDWLVLVRLLFSILFIFNDEFVRFLSHLLCHHQLAGTNRPIALAQANAVVNRIDLLCEVMKCFLFFFVCTFASFVLLSKQMLREFDQLQF